MVKLKTTQNITRCIRKFAIKFSGNFKVYTSKPSHTPKRYLPLKRTQTLVIIIFYELNIYLNHLLLS
jgi:hypothetical protein